MVKKSDKVSVDQKIYKFNIKSQLEPESKIMLIGRPGSGKSSLIYDIMMEFRDKFPVVNIFNGSEMENRAYETTVPPTAISNDFDEKRMENIIRRQRLLKSRKHPNPYAMTIVDDCSDNPRNYDTKLFKKIFKLGRHYAHMIIFGFQEALDLPRSMRSALDYIFIFKETSPSSLALLYKNYAPGCLTFKQFKSLMDACTGDHQCMVIKNYKSGDTIDKTYFYYKAPLFRKDEIKVGCRQFWADCAEHLNPEYDDEKELMSAQ